MSRVVQFCFCSPRLIRKPTSPIIILLLITCALFFLIQNLWDLTLRFSSRVEITDWYFQPTSCDRRPSVQYYNQSINNVLIIHKLHWKWKTQYYQSVVSNTVILKLAQMLTTSSHHSEPEQVDFFSVWLVAVVEYRKGQIEHNQVLFYNCPQFIRNLDH